MSIIPLLHKHGKSEPVGLSELSPIFAIIAFVALWRVLSHLTAFSNLPPFYIPFSSFLFLALHLSLSLLLSTRKGKGRDAFIPLFFNLTSWAYVGPRMQDSCSLCTLLSWMGSLSLSDYCIQRLSPKKVFHKRVEKMRKKMKMTS